MELVPKQHSSGGKDKLGSISKQGDRYLRSLFTAGALAVRYAKIHGSQHRPWLTALLAIAGRMRLFQNTTARLFGGRKETAPGKTRGRFITPPLHYAASPSARV